MDGDKQEYKAWLLIEMRRIIDRIRYSDRRWGYDNTVSDVDLAALAKATEIYKSL